ncbi:unnamed protein product [Ectocarpus sp. 6 AP-2014]
MGNSPSLTRSFEKTRSEIESIKGDGGGKWEELNVCLLCQKNTYQTALNDTPTGEVKSAITDFLNEVYDTSDAATLNWTTWDLDHADIVLAEMEDLRNPNTAPAFDVMVELHCEIACPGNESAPPADDYRAMCRLLKTGGLLVVPRSFGEINHIAGIHPEYICQDPSGAELVPIFSVSPGEGETAANPLASGITVFRKM